MKRKRVLDSTPLPSHSRSASASTPTAGKKRGCHTCRFTNFRPPWLISQHSLPPIKDQANRLSRLQSRFQPIQTQSRVCLRYPWVMESTQSWKPFRKISRRHRRRHSTVFLQLERERSVPIPFTLAQVLFRGNRSIFQRRFHVNIVRNREDSLRMLTIPLTRPRNVSALAGC